MNNFKKVNVCQWYSNALKTNDLGFDNFLFLLLGSIKELIWKANLQMKWPEEFEVEGIARRKTDAINICYLLACHKLKVCYIFILFI